MDTRLSGHIARKTSIHKACRLGFQSPPLNLENQSPLSTQRKFGHVHSEVGKLQILPNMSFVTRPKYGWNVEADCVYRIGCCGWKLLLCASINAYEIGASLTATDPQRPVAPSEVLRQVVERTGRSRRMLTVSNSAFSGIHAVTASFSNAPVSCRSGKNREGRQVAVATNSHPSRSPHERENRTRLCR